MIKTIGQEQHRWSQPPRSQHAVYWRRDRAYEVYVYCAAVDRPLDDEQLEFMRRQSTRWRFLAASSNEYCFGDFQVCAATGKTSMIAWFQCHSQ